MSIAIKAKIIGMDPLIRKLRVLPDEAIKHLREALGREADTIVDFMKRLVPVRDGDLKESIGWVWGNKAPKGSIAVATKGKGGLSITIFAGNEKAYYARWVEFGSAAHTAGGKFAGAEIPAIAAQPFFYPGWRAGKKGAKAGIRKASREAVRKVVNS